MDGTAPPPPPPPSLGVAPPPPAPPKLKASLNTGSNTNINNSVSVAAAAGQTSLAALLARRRAAADSSSEGSATNDEVATTAGRGLNFAHFQEKGPTGHIGLTNQGATCYLNSLIQTLFMTPELRRALFAQFAFERARDGPEHRSIPLQLQRLFARLQLSDCPVLDSKDLTKSFGWTESDAFQQHDVQELMTKLIEALEKSLTQDNNFTTSLFGGKMVDFITCQECGLSRRRDDPFINVPLAIRGVGSIETALQLYTTPDLLTGSNQWVCDACGHRVDALKGLMFQELPYILTLQLKRFDYDPATWRRIKLNDRVSFPLKLDMSPFLVEKVDFSSSPSVVYELFSVMIHSGGAMGGHYYAFIKSFDSGKWIKFNDSSVTFIEESEIETMFGIAAQNSNNPAPAAGGFSTNAYMLVYRRVDPTVNVSRVPDEDVPCWLREEVAAENAEFARERAEFIRRRDAIHCTVWYSDELEKNFQVTLDKHATLAQLLDACVAEAAKVGGGAVVSLDRARLRPLNVDTKSRGSVWKLESSANLTLEALKFTPTKHLVLEIQDEATGKWNNDPNDENDGEEVLSLVIRVVRYIEEINEFAPPVPLKMTSKSTLADLRRQIESSDALCSIPNAQQRLFFLSSQDAAAGVPHEITAPGGDLLIADLSLFDGATIHLESQSQAVTSGRGVISKFEEERNKIQLFYNNLESRELNLELFIDKRRTIAELKAEIAALIGAPVDSFKLCNGLLAKEFKEQNKSLADSGLYDGSAVFLQSGTPAHLSAQTKIIFYRLCPDPQLFCELSLDSSSTSITVGHVREKLFDYLISVAREGVSSPTSARQLRLREKRSSRPASILRDSMPLVQQQKLSREPTVVELFFQVLESEETLGEHDMILDLRRWYPLEQRLSQEPLELIVPKSTTIFGLKTILSEPNGIPIQYLCISKPFSYQLKGKEQQASIATLNWHVDDASGLTTSPWYLHDGDTLLFKDDREAEVLPEGQQLEQQGGGARSTQRERSLQIRTFYDEDEETQAAIEASLRGL